MPKPAVDKTPPPNDPTPPPPVQTVEFDFRGETFSIPKDRDDWDTEAFIAIANGDIYTSLQIMLGPEQWLKLRRIGTSRRLANEFSQKFGEVATAECIN